MFKPPPTGTIRLMGWLESGSELGFVDHLGLAGARVVLIDLKKMGVVGQAHLDNF